MHGSAVRGILYDFWGLEIEIPERIKASGDIPVALRFSTMLASLVLGNPMSLVYRVRSTLLWKVPDLRRGELTSCLWQMFHYCW